MIYLFFSFLKERKEMPKLTKRFYVEELYKNDNNLSKTKLFKMKLQELQTMYNNLNLKSSFDDSYQRANFDDIDISDDEKETVEQESTIEPIVETVQETIVEQPVETVQEPIKQEEKKQKFNRRELKNKYLKPFNKEVSELIKDLSENHINKEIALHEFNIMYEEYLSDIENYVQNIELEESNLHYIDKFFELEERRFIKCLN